MGLPDWIGEDQKIRDVRYIEAEYELLGVEAGSVLNTVTGDHAPAMQLRLRSMTGEQDEVHEVTVVLNGRWVDVVVELLMSQGPVRLREEIVNLLGKHT